MFKIITEKRSPEEISTMRMKSFGEIAGKVLKNVTVISVNDGKKKKYSYDGKHKDKEYFYAKGYNSNKLGKYGKVGDPYTYEVVNKAQNKYKVATGPKKSVMGKVFTIKAQPKRGTSAAIQKNKVKFEASEGKKKKNIRICMHMLSHC